LDSITLVGADGRGLNDSRVFPVPVVNVADQDYFVTLRDNPAESTLLAQPVQSSVMGAKAMFLARRINSRDGAFLGLILGAINLTQFEHDFKTIEAAAGVAVDLWHKDNLRLTPYLPQENINPIESPSVEEFSESGGLTYVARIPQNESGRIVATMPT